MKAVKLQDVFYFEKEINLDSFTIDSSEITDNGGRVQSDAILTRETAQKKRDEELEKVERQIEKIEKRQKECSNSDCAPDKLKESFENVMQFLEKQKQESEDFTDLDYFDVSCL